MKIKGIITREKVLYKLLLQDFLEGKWLEIIAPDFEIENVKIDVTYSDGILTVQTFKSE